MSLAHGRPEERDGTLLRAATALFCQEPIHDRDAIRRYEQLALHLLPKLKPNDRAYIASLLGGRSDAPPSVMRLLARDAIGIAGPVLRHSAVLKTIDLLGVIAATGPDHHQMIASRRDLSPDVLRALDLAREKNAVAETPKTASDKIDEGRDAPGPATSRPASIPTPSFDDFLGAPKERRLKILGEASSRRWRANRNGRNESPEQALQRTFASAEIVHAAKRHDRPALIDAFSRALGIDKPIATQLLADPSGEPLVLMIKAAGLSIADGRTVLLLANRQIGESVETFLQLADLFASLERATADAFIESWRPAAVARRAGHVPVFSEPAERAAAPVARSEEAEERKRAEG